MTPVPALSQPSADARSDPALDHILDPGPLLRPITDDRPAGTALDAGRDYAAIRKARRADDPTTPRGIWQTRLKQADWRTVADQCSEILAHRSKDLTVAAWLVEAWTHLHGLPGTIAGLELLTGLVTRFWDGLEPPVADGDDSLRARPLEWLNRNLPVLLNQMPVAAPSREFGTRHTWTDYCNARHRAVAAASNPKAAADGPTFDQIEAGIDATPVDFHLDLYHRLGQTLHRLDRLEEALYAQWPGQPPTLGRIRETLDGIAGRVAIALADKGLDGDLLPGGGSDADDVLDDPADPIDDDPPEAGPVDGLIADGGEPPATGRHGPIRSRDDAYRRLAEIAEFLAHTEPHSPVPYLLRRAIHWGRMPLDRLLLDMTRGSRDLAPLLDLLGLDEDR